jgi:hypothetical protein
VPQTPSPRGNTAFWVFLALSARARRVAAWLVTPLTAPLRFASRLAFGLAALLRVMAFPFAHPRLFAQAAGAFASQFPLRHRLFVAMVALAIGSGVAGSQLFLAQTTPGRAPEVAWGSDAAAVDLAYYSGLFVDQRTADMSVAECANGMAARVGSYFCDQPLAIVGDADEIFALAKMAYRGEALPADATAAQRRVASFFAGKMLEDRGMKAFNRGFEPVLIGLILFFTLAGSVVFVWRFAFSNSFFQRVLRVNSPGGSVLSLPMSFCCAAGFMFGLPTVAAVSLMVAAIHVPAAAGFMVATRCSAVFVDSTLTDRPREMLLSTVSRRMDRSVWTDGPNALRLVDRSHARDGALAIGAWRPSELLRSDAAALLSERAPGLSPMERRAALSGIAFAREEAFGVSRQNFWDWLGLGFMVATFAAIGAGGLAGLFYLFRGAFRNLRQSASGAINKLAEEGQRLPLARREQSEIEAAIGGGRNEGAEPLPRREPPRL